MSRTSPIYHCGNCNSGSLPSACDCKLREVENAHAELDRTAEAKANERQRLREQETEQTRANERAKEEARRTQAEAARQADSQGSANGSFNTGLPTRNANSARLMASASPIAGASKAR